MRWFNKKQEIAKSLESLDRFYVLLKARCIAGKGLQEFCVLGRYHLDRFGNTHLMLEEPPESVFPDIPPVLSMEELRQYYSDRGQTPAYSMRSVGSLPTSRMVCSECGKGWGLHDCHQAVIYQDEILLVLTDFVGQTLEQAQRALSQKTDGAYMINRFRMRNDKLINLTPVQVGSIEEPENEYGWIYNDNGISYQYVIEVGDEFAVTKTIYRHPACNAIERKRTFEKEYRTVFEEAGFSILQMTAVPSGYCPCERCPPWFVVETSLGPILIGRRRRVTCIGWAQTIFRGSVTKDDVTQEPTYVHAWKREKQVEYLRKLRTHLAPTM